jgi:uncharacterized protein (DUF1015 family)
MSLIHPIQGLRPTPGHVADVIAPPYDVVGTEEARARAEGRPWSFLHISKPEIDLPPGTDPHSEAVYERGRETFRSMREGHVLVRDPAPSLYVYRLIQGGHIQTGLVGGASVAAYEDGRIRKHEHTQPEKEDDRVRQIAALGAQTGPVMLVHRSHEKLRRAVAAETGSAPQVDTTFEGVRHQLWAVTDPVRIVRLTRALDGLDTLYIADGHHRSAAAARVARERRIAGEGPWNLFLSVTFPEEDLRILPYNRLVRDLGGRSPREFLVEVGERFRVSSRDEAVAPDRPRAFGLYLDGSWYELRFTATESEDPVARLDVGLLSRHLLEPLLDIHDQHTDPRIEFVGGSRGLGELEHRVDSGTMAAAFTLPPTPVAGLLAVADAGEVMPTKSTWFEPKLADGLVTHLIE